MIIRKPYAFLIKYFKIIHIVLFFLMAYLLFRIRNVYMFFRNYLSTGTYTFKENMVSSYINVPMIIFTIILIAFLLLIFFLMRQKKKPIFYYLTATIFYFVTFVSCLYFISVFANLEYQAYSNQALVIYRDLTMVLYFLNYYFLAISFVRGFGFNVKKFNFEKDLKELEISDEDREEIEVASPVDLENVSNFLRKRKRHFGYYLKENSFMLIVFVVIICMSLATYFTLNKLVFNKTYHVNEVITYNNVDYVINNLYLTNKDKYGNVIKNQNTYYLLVDISVTNKNEESFKLDTSNTRLRVGDKYYYASNNLASKFNDLGVTYRKESLLKDVKKDFIMIFEVNNPNILKEKIVFELYTSKKVVDGEAVLYYKNVSLKPYLFEEKELGDYKFNSKVDLKSTYLKKGEFNLTAYEIADIINYTYTKCNSKNDGECKEYKASVVPKSSSTLLKVSYITEIENNLFNYLSLEYSSDSSTKKVKMSEIKDVTPENYNEEGVRILEVPKDIVNSTNVKFNFNLRGVTFTYE